MAIKIKLTEKTLQNLTFPTSQPRQIYTDTDSPGAKRREAVPGLQAVVFRSGTISFVLCRKFQGRTRFITLGRYPDLSVDQARAEARELIASMRKGIDPSAQKRANGQRRITLKHAFAEYIEVRKRHLSPNTISNYKTVMAKHLGQWQNKELSEISRNMVQSRHRDLSEISPTGANKAMRVLRAIYNFANGQYEDERGQGLFPDNPVSRISHVRIWNKENRRQNVIGNSEFKPWFDAVLDIDPGDEQACTVRDYLIVLLLTGMRRREAAPLRWDDVSFEEKLLSVGETKNGDPLLLPITDYLCEVLQTRFRKSDSPFVFPGSGRTKYINEPKRRIARIREESGVYFTLHDLRRTFITVAESIDIPAYTLKRLVNHRVKGDVTEGYIVIGIERLRGPMQQITDHILSLAGIKNSAEIVPLKENRIKM